MLKDKWTQACLQPGAKGLEARKTLERAWKSYNLIRWIPIVGWLTKLFMKPIYPTIEEVEEAMRKQNKRY